MRAFRRGTISLGLLALLAGCGDDDDPFQPTVETVTGSYTAASFTAETVLPVEYSCPNSMQTAAQCPKQP